MLNRRHVQQRFERAAATFDDSDFVHALSREQLLSRIQPLIIDAKTVVDLGAATGASQKPLAKRFQGAHVVSIDIAAAMLRRARRKKSWFAKSAYVQASAEALPLAEQSVDVVFANQLLPWADNPDPIFAEVARVLKKGGVFAFASLGPDTLQSLRHAWQQVDDTQHVHRFPDMHDVGDGLVRAGLADPVLDVDRLSISYDSPRKLFTDLSHVGARNALHARHHALFSPSRFKAFELALEKDAIDGKICVELELVYGHCWGAGARMDASNYRIDAQEIPIRARR